MRRRCRERRAQVHCALAMRRLWFTSLLAVAIVAALVARVEPRKVLGAVREADAPLLAAALALPYLSLALKGLRWSTAIGAALGRRPRRGVFSAMILGTATNLILPARLGDIVRGLQLRRYEGVPLALGLSSGVSVQLLDVVAVGCLFLAGVGRGVLPPERAAALGLVAACSLTAVALLERRLKAGERMDHRSRVSKPAAALIVEARRGFHYLRQGSALVRVAAATTAIWAIDVATTIVALRAFALPADVDLAALLVAGVGISFLLPLTPGNIGTYQLVCVAILGTAGVPEERALAYGFAVQGASTTILLLLTAGLLHREAISVGELRRHAEREAAERSAATNSDAERGASAKE